MCFHFFKHKAYPVKQELATSLALALEFKMGAEILKTVLIRKLLKKSLILQLAIKR